MKITGLALLIVGIVLIKSGTKKISSLGSIKQIKKITPKTRLNKMIKVIKT